MDQQHDITVEEYAGTRTVTIDGQDITNEIVGVEIAIRPSEATAVMLFAKPDSVLLHEKAFIYVQASIGAQKLDDLNPAAIEAEAMSREEWGSGKSLVENIIDVIKEKLGAPDQS